MEQEMNNRSIGKKATFTFFLIVILLSAVVETLICRGGPEWLYRFKLRFLPGNQYAKIRICIGGY